MEFEYYHCPTCNSLWKQPIDIGDEVVCPYCGNIFETDYDYDEDGSITIWIK